MKGMASAQGQKACPNDGRYWFNVTAADPGFTQVKQTPSGQKGGDSKISLAMEIAEGEHAGYPAFDELGTDGGTNFGAMSKKRLRQLEVPGLDSDAEVPDDVVAASLLNRRLLVEVKREQREDKDGNKQFDIDEKTGVKVPLYRLRVIGYIKQPTAGAQAGAPQGMPQGLPPGLPPGMPAGAFPGAPQFAPPAPQYAAPPGAPQYPQQPQYAVPGAPPAPGQWAGGPTGGYAPPAPGAAPGAYAAPGAPGGFPQVQPPAAWANGAPPAPGIPGGQPGLPFPGAPGAPGVPGR